MITINMLLILTHLHKYDITNWWPYWNLLIIEIAELRGLKLYKNDIHFMELISTSDTEI